MSQNRSGGGDILIIAGHTLWRLLAVDGLVDELHLMVGSVALGGGTTIVSTPVDPRTLVESRRFDSSSNVLLTYGLARP